jgi:asparagine synthase (glutamine-hydrolysing)
MCGIAGFWSPSPVPGAQARIAAMTGTLVHRGPDAGGTWRDDEAGLALGHRRLAILDLSERGAQPMHSACGRFVITFNGEIYNHLDLRRELDAQGAAPNWRSTSDTETLLAGFAAWGIAPTLQKSVGMFALGLWDRAERRLTLARDRFGEKPLYYGWAGQGAHTAFVFGSEMKALRAFPGFGDALDREALALYLRFCYVPAPRTIHTHARKLVPGTILTLSARDLHEREPRPEPYWRYEDVALAGLVDPVREEREGLERLQAALNDAIRLQLVADVPVGAFLSGGIDSSTVVALMQARSSRPVKTFTIGFDEAGFDEAPFAAAVAKHLGTDHTEVRVSAGEAREIIPRLPGMYDEPFADSSQIPTSIICAVARRHVTVALSGDGGDELLGGYNRYLWGPRFWRTVSVLPPPLRRLAGRLIQVLPPGRWNEIGRLTGLDRRIGLVGDKLHRLADRLGSVASVDDVFRSMVAEWRPDAAPLAFASAAAAPLDLMHYEDRIPDPEHRMMLIDGLTYLPDDILTKVDRAAMAVSLETRVPLLDHRVAEAAWRLPLAMKLRDGKGKWALRQILDRHVPRELIERPKAGFAIPVGQWMRGPLRDWAEALLAPARLSGDGLFDSARVRTLWDEHQSGQRDWTARLWAVLMFQAWQDAIRAGSDEAA